jgi:hypothetical protein
VDLNIVNELATLERLTIGQLRQRFAELFGEATYPGLFTATSSHSSAKTTRRLTMMICVDSSRPDARSRLSRRRPAVRGEDGLVC